MNILLKVIMYNVIPQNTPKNIYPLTIPLLYMKIEDISIAPADIQKIISSNAVNIFPAPKLLRNILKKSNRTPIIIPSNEKSKNNIA